MHALFYTCTYPFQIKQNLSKITQFGLVHYRGFKSCKYAIARRQLLDLPGNPPCCNFLTWTEQLCSTKLISLTFHPQIENTLICCCSLLFW